MNSFNNTTSNRLLAKISSMYYDQNFNQQEIADRLQLSRPKISRLLKKAREKGIVQITVIKPDSNFLSLEQELEEEFDLTEVLIGETEPNSSPQRVKHQVGKTAANYLHRTISKGDLIGVTWGTTLQAMIDSMKKKQIPPTHVIQALGGVGAPEAKAYATDISRRLSQLLGSKLTLLPAPGVAGSSKTKEVLLSDRKVKKSLALFSKIDTLFVGIGAITTNPVLDKNSDEINSEIHREILKSKAVGDIALRFFDAEGEEIESQLKDLVIGISIDEIKSVDTVVGVATGRDKANAIKGALRGGLVDVLITDSITAQAVK